MAPLARGCRILERISRGKLRFQAREILHPGPNAYYKQNGADAIDSAAATTERLKKVKDQVFGQGVH